MPALKAAADNPEGTFTSAAEAGPEIDEDETGRSLPFVMTEVVGLLVTAMHCYKLALKNKLSFIFQSNKSKIK
jgi:hypothetical protein